MNVDLIVLSIPIFFLLIGLEVVYDRIKNKKLYRLNDAFANISCGITEQVSGVFAKVFTIAAYDLVFVNFHLFEIPNNWMWWIIAFIGVDFFYYWAHRSSHEINLFWAGHVVHHQSEEYNLSVALRQSAMQKVYTFYFYLPMAFIGFKTEWFLLISAINLLYQFWIHTEAVGKMGPLEWVMNTPSHHRVHHGRNPKYIDKNHAGTFIIWDRMFGTFQEEEERPTYGITTPLNTFNPVFAQVAHYKNIWQDLKQCPGFINKLKVLFYKPGWLPNEVGGYRNPPEVIKSEYAKYDIQLPLSLNIYLFTQYLISLGATAFYLFQQHTLAIDLRISAAVLIFFTVGVLGLVFSGKRYAFYLELLRLSITIPFFLFMTNAMDGFNPLMIGMVIWLIGSLFWFIPLHKVLVK
jgi:sterol desaturase/sphingolipid hydroxylase (fatty acid hydroxylase superfamily)